MCVGLCSGYPIILFVMMMNFKDFSILSWNIMGVVNKIGRRHSRELVHNYKPGLVILMETHCSFYKAMRFWKWLGFEAYGIAEANGHAGGLWVLSEVGNGVVISVVEVHHQAGTVSMSRDSDKWFCTTVYASLILVVREQLWCYLEQLHSMVDGPWALISDFNDILLPSEVMWGSFSINRANRFAEIVEMCGLLDLGASANSFTWYRKPKGFI